VKKILMFYLDGCPYCRDAMQAVHELREKDPAYGALEIEMVEETRRRDLSDAHDYYYVPTLYVGDEKVYEARPGQRYREIRANVKRAFDRALQG
jgi:glutaredoxin